MPVSAPGTITLLIVEDQEELRTQLDWALRDEFRVLLAADRDQALGKLQHERVDVILCDLHLTPAEQHTADGLDVISAANAKQPAVPVVVITGSSSRRAALEAIKRGAYGFFEKPFDPDEAAHIIRQAAHLRRMEQELLKLRSEHIGDIGFALMLGGGPALARTVKQARTVADTNATVLITGESGTGKELLARAIHFEGARAAGPFIGVSCAALPETLIESELFGYEKGAFTNALNSKQGRFELADGGTLFLDEISELTPAVQVTLLRVLQERSFERVGGTKTINVDIRLIAATNRDLAKEVDEGRFRKDLFYRLNVIPLVLPPLRDRQEDVALLAAHFAVRFAERHNRPQPRLRPELIEALHEHTWPGNVRELENLMERLIVLTGETEIGTEFLPDDMLRHPPDASTADESTLEGAIRALRIRMINQALELDKGNRAAAARRLAISRSYMHRLIKELGIEPNE
ncbi:MAG: sigma-54 dependent transcriptional regulator [Pyrinomonadaceae bacterium]